MLKERNFQPKSVQILVGLYDEAEQFLKNAVANWKDKMRKLSVGPYHLQQEHSKRLDRFQLL